MDEGYQLAQLLVLIFFNLKLLKVINWVGVVVTFK